jgi:peptide/nickel transport system substrate-binding protein
MLSPVSTRGLVLTIGIVALATSLAACVVLGTRLVTDSVVRVAVEDTLTTFYPASPTQAGPTNVAVELLTRDQFFTYAADGELVPNTGFGTAIPLPGTSFTVEYSPAGSATWSDGVSVVAADLLLAWVASSGALDSLFAPEALFGAPGSVPLANPPVFPAVSDDGRSLTVDYGERIAGWQTLLDVHFAAHMLAEKALGISDPDPARSAVIDAILPKDAVALAALAESWNAALVVGSSVNEIALLSSGPYEVVSLADGEVILVANAAYRGSRQPRVETIELVTIRDPLEAVRALKKGTVDIITPDPTPAVQEALASSGRITALIESAGPREHVNLQIAGGKSGVFADPRVREAFLLTIPRQQIISELGNELASHASVQDSFLVEQNSPGYPDIVASNGPSAYAEPNAEAAVTLLAAAGIAAPEVCILFDAYDETRVREFDLIANAAGAAGFIVTDCSHPDLAGQLGRIGAYDAVLFAWSSQPTAGWATTLYSTTGSNNFTGYSSDLVDGLLVTLAGESETATRLDILAQIDARL